MTQYEAIGRRHSVRRFQMTAIDPHIMKQINIHMKINNPDARDKVENKETNSKGKVENSQVFTVLD